MTNVENSYAPITTTDKIQPPDVMKGIIIRNFIMNIHGMALTRARKIPAFSVGTAGWER